MLNPHGMRGKEHCLHTPAHVAASFQSFLHLPTSGRSLSPFKTCQNVTGSEVLPARWKEGSICVHWKLLICLQPCA